MKLPAAALGLTLALAAAAAPERERLTACPSAPHCVSSLETDARHGIAPFMLKTNAPASWDGIVAAVQGLARTTIVSRDAHYLHAEVLSPWHVYTDDLELRWDAASDRVDVRSSSRVGYYDFGVNRDRVEALRQRLAAAGLIR